MQKLDNLIAMSSVSLKTWINFVSNKILQCKKSNLHYTRGITPKHVTSGGVHLRDLAPGQHSSEETSQ